LPETESCNSLFSNIPTAGVIIKKYEKYATEDTCPIRTHGASGACAPTTVKIKKSATKNQKKNFAIGLNW